MTLATDLNLRVTVVAEGVKTTKEGWEHYAYTVTLHGPGGNTTP